MTHPGNPDSHGPSDNLAVTVGTLKAVLKGLGHTESEIEEAVKNVDNGQDSQQKPLAEQDAQTMYIVVDPGGFTANHSVLGHDTIVGVYDTQEKAETAAENLGDYQYAADMGRGELYPSALIYESQLNE